MSTADRRLRLDALVALLSLGLLIVWDLTGLDLTVSSWFGDGDGFPWRSAWLTSTLLHEGGRALAWAVLAITAIRAAYPRVDGPSRAERLWWIGVTLLCITVVPGLKLASLTSCPWDLERFGGVAMYVSHWRLGVSDGGPGRCFPSGHAVAAFALMTGYFLWRGHRPTVARWWLSLVGAAGILFSGAQVARGAHFLSHVLWSAWLCWALCSIAAAGAGRCFRRRADAPFEAGTLPLQPGFSFQTHHKQLESTPHRRSHRAGRPDVAAEIATCRND